MKLSYITALVVVSVHDDTMFAGAVKVAMDGAPAARKPRPRNNAKVNFWIRKGENHRATDEKSIAEGIDERRGRARLQTAVSRVQQILKEKKENESAAPDDVFLQLHSYHI